MAAESSPQPLVVGELIQNNTTTIPNQKENTIIQNNQLSYAASLIQTNSVFLNQTNLKQFEVIHGVPTIQFTKEERLDYAKEEGLHQAIVVKLSSNKMELSTLRNLLPKILGIKGQALIGQLAPRQILIRMDQFDDFGTSLARSVLYLNHNGREHQIRVFPWSIDFNVMEETTKAVVWISMPNLPPELFAKKALLSIASAVGMPISIDKATQVKSRPSVARVKVILDLKDKLPEKVALQFVDKQTGKINEFCQDLVYDNLPLYCFHCKHQGHDENTCRKLNGKTVANAQAIVQVEEKIVTQGEAKTDMNDGAVIEKLQGDVKRVTEVLNGVTEVLNGVTEVIDPLGELTTTGKGKKDNKSTCTWSQSSVQHDARRKESDTIIDEGSFGHKGIVVHQLKEKDDKHGDHPSIETASLVKVSIEDKIAFSPKVAGHVLLEDVGRGNGQRARLISQKDEAAGPLKRIKNTIHTTSKGGNAQVAQQDKVAGQVNKVADHVNESHAQIDSAVGQSEHLKGIDAGNGKAKQMVGHVKAKEAENMEKIGKAHAVLMTAEMEQMVGHVKAKEAKNLEQIDGHFAGHVNEKAAENMEHKLINFAVQRSENLKQPNVMARSAVGHEFDVGSHGQRAAVCAADSKACNGQSNAPKQSNNNVFSTKMAGHEGNKQATACTDNAKKFAEVGLNTSNHEVPSNESFDRPINNNQVTLSMLSSATKNPRGGTDSNAYEDEMSEELQEAVISKRKSWADIAEEHDEEEENSQDFGSSTRQGGKGNEGAVALNELTPTNILQAIVNVSAAIPERKQCFTDHERSFLDALASPNHHKIGCLSGSKTTARKQKSVAKRQEPGSARKAKRDEPLWMFLQEEIFQKLVTNLRIASSHETKEDELIESPPEEATTIRDLSPKNAEEKKVTQEITLRQLPMRAAKQKGIASSTSTRSNISDKK